MTPQTMTIEIQKESQDEARQEPFVRQVDDRSLPAQQVLTDQQEDRAPAERPVLFVP